MGTHSSPARFALVFLVLAVLACNGLTRPTPTALLVPTVTTPSQPATSELTPAALVATAGAANPNANTILAIAVRLDGGRPTLVGYLGDPAQTPFEPPAGRYFVDVMDSNGLSLSLGKVDVTAAAGVTLPASVADAGGKADPKQADLLGTLGKFLIGAELAKLTAYDAASQGFTTRLFEKAAQPGQDSLNQLYARDTALSNQEQAVMAAADALQTQIPAGFFRPNRGANGLGAPAPGPAAGLKDALLGFFGYARDTGLRARNRIIQIAAGLDANDKADAFNAVRAGFKGDAQNLDDLLAQLASGKLDKQAAQIESDMRNAPGFGAQAQQTNNTVDQVSKREGGELVTKGVELQVEVIKTVLGKISPKLTEGYELAEKGAKWAQYIHDFYNNPLNAAENLTREQLIEKIKARIASDLAECCPGIPSNIADQIAGGVSEGAVGAIPKFTLDSTAVAATAIQHSLETQQAPATAVQQTAEAAAQETTDAGAQQTSDAGAAAQETQALAATLTKIARLTQIAIPVASDTPAPTPTFAPVFLEELFHPGNVFAVSTKNVLQPNRMYQFCFSGIVNLVNPDKAAQPWELDHVNGIAVPTSDCLALEGTGQVAVISCGSGEAAPDPGGFTIRVVDLGPK